MAVPYPVFVYGSLRKGETNAAEMAGSRFLGLGRTRSGFRKVLFEGGYPAVYFSSNFAGAVSGELYEVDEAHLGRLDAFEGCPDWYERALIELDDQTMAYAYVIPEARGRVLPDFEK